MATDPPPTLVLSALNGRSHSVREWLTTFHLLFVAIGTEGPSRWIVPTARRVLYDYEQADCRVAWLVAGDASDARRLLGAKIADSDLVFLDPDLVAVKAFGLATLPAIVHLGIDGTVVNAVEGWDPAAWRVLTVELSRQVGWSHPRLPDPRDPGPFKGAPLPARSR
ncbi:MAG: hypothetical protein QOI56_1229 [Actinomycetota bacterium]|nr:hypothetical protein [Actinomycetota bacterium]MEA2932444.1 hypothetical protein [Actinomycetota bacterium]